MTWAFAQALKPSSLKFLLVALADNADDEGRAFPSIDMLSTKTSQDRKTVIAGLDRLEELRLATDTGSRVGKTKQVKVYRLERFTEATNSTVNGIVEGQTNSPVNGTAPGSETVPKPEQFRKRNSSEIPSKESQKRTPSPSFSPLTLSPLTPPTLEPSGNRKRRASAQARSRRVPADFVITEEMRSWAKAACSNVDIDRETECFRDHEYRDPHSDWTAAWRTWMRRAPEFKRAGAASQDEPKLTWRPTDEDEANASR